MLRGKPHDQRHGRTIGSYVHANRMLARRLEAERANLAPTQVQRSVEKPLKGN
ncbi:hypothetical protein [Mesorhizobium sp.]|uniref:hypothetical protein n=1 Tax=Mesorhizobium sp. TaxID=1871066 RepID=UPI00257DF1D5|nr:hypothetical protein [Mesorhizobium sp.]